MTEVVQETIKSITWFQQNETACSTSLPVTRQFFLEKSILRRGDINWSANSLDLTSLGFFAASVKSKVFIKVQSILVGEIIHYFTTYFEKTSRTFSTCSWPIFIKQITLHIERG